MSRLESDGAAIDYLEGGSGPPFVLVHGAWGDRGIWEPVRRRLEGSFRAIAYSRRGHGDSTGGGPLDADVRDLATLIEHLDAAPAHLAGNSTGATVCLRLVASRPDLVASLNAHEPPLVGLLAGDPTWEPLLGEVERRIGGVVELIEQDRAPEAAERFAEEVVLGPGSWAQFPPEERERFIRNAATFVEENAEPTIYGIDPTALADVTTPVLLSGGAASPPLFEPVLERLAAVLPRAVRHRFPEAGHFAHVSHPSEYAKVIAEFASRANAAHGATTGEATTGTPAGPGP